MLEQITRYVVICDWCGEKNGRYLDAAEAERKSAYLGWLRRGAEHLCSSCAAEQPDDKRNPIEPSTSALDAALREAERHKRRYTELAEKANVVDEISEDPRGTARLFVAIGDMARVLGQHKLEAK